MWWRHDTAIDLGAFPEDRSSNAYNVNSHGQVVGTSEDRAHMLIGVGEHAFLSENGGPIVDLNTLIPPGSSLQLTYAVGIHDAGEIVGFGVPSGVPPEDYETQGHAYVLIPCDENHPGVEGCDYDLVDADGAVRESGRGDQTEGTDSHGRTDPSRKTIVAGNIPWMSRQRLRTRYQLSSPAAANEGSSCEKTSIPSSSYSSKNIIAEYHPELRNIHRGGYRSAPGGVLTNRLLPGRAGGDMSRRVRSNSLSAPA